MDAARLTRLIQFARQQEATKALAAASFTFLTYDIFLTLDEEKRHMWDSKPRLSLVKILFYINRYFTPLQAFINLYVQFSRAPSATLCDFATHFASYAGILIFSVVDATLMLRVWALYDRGKVMRWVLIVAMFLIVTAYIVLLGIATPDIKNSHISPLPGVITGCMQSGPLIYFFLFALTVFIEAILFGMTLFKVIKHMRGNSRLPVIQYIFSSGLLYFLIVLVTCVFTIASHFIRVANPKIQLPGANSNFVVDASSVVCSRLLLGIRELNSTHVEPPSSFVTPTSRDRSGREEIELEGTSTKQSVVVFHRFSEPNGEEAYGGRNFISLRRDVP